MIKIPREGSIRRKVVDWIVEMGLNSTFEWGAAKAMYDSQSQGSPRYTSMELSRLLRDWAIRIGPRGRSLYKPRYLRCACTQHLLDNSLEKLTPKIDSYDITHTWDNCAEVQNLDEKIIARADHLLKKDQVRCACGAVVLSDIDLKVYQDDEQHGSEWCKDGKRASITSDLKINSMVDLLKSLLNDEPAIPKELADEAIRLTELHAKSQEQLNEAAMIYAEVDKLLDAVLEKIKPFIGRNNESDRQTA